MLMLHNWKTTLWVSENYNLDHCAYCGIFRLRADGGEFFLLNWIHGWWDPVTCDGRKKLTKQPPAYLRGPRTRSKTKKSKKAKGKK